MRDCQEQTERDQEQYNAYMQSLLALEDEAVCMLSQKGDDIAMESLLFKYKPLIRRIARCYFLVGADAEDLIQEGTIGLLKAIQHYHAERNVRFCSFAELCIKRQIISAIKMANRKKHSPLNSYISLDQPLSKEDTERSLMDIISNAQNPEEMMLGKETLLHIQSYMDTALSKLEKKVFAYYIAGKSYEDIAKLIGKPEKSVDNALQRIRKKLISALGSSE